MSTTYNYSRGSFKTRFISLYTITLSNSCFFITSSVADSIRESTLDESSPILLVSVHKTPSVVHVPFSQTVLFFQFSLAQPMLHNYYYDSILVLLDESLLLRFRSFVYYYLRYTKLD